MFIFLAAFLICAYSCQGYYSKFAGCPVVMKEKCDSQFVKFFLHTRETKASGGEFILFSDDGSNNLTNSHYKPQIKSVLIIHGFADSSRMDSLQQIKEEYLSREEMNIWLMDWSLLTPSHPLCYITSVINLGYVGQCLANFTRALGSPKSGLHVVGFSLGGHVAGLAANHLRPYLIPRITGLDPALPLFIGIGHQQRLSPDDGQFVDVIHTNAFFQGNFLPMGHVDFFVNGGIEQPGCGSIFHSLGCSHQRNPIYYAESINTKKGFWGWSCNKLLDAFRNKCNMSEPFYIMGDQASNSTRGLIYIKTSDKPPFAVGKPQDLEASNEDPTVIVL